MNRKTMAKAIAALLAFILSFANVAIIGSYRGETQAATVSESQNTNCGAGVTFDAYFKEGENRVHNKNVNVTDNTNLYIRITTQRGNLTGAEIQIENANFNIQYTNENYDKIQSINSSENKIELNSINKNETVELAIPIKMHNYSSIDISELSKIANVKFKADLHDENGVFGLSNVIRICATLDGEAER